MTHRDCLRLRPHVRLYVMAGKRTHRQRHRQLLRVTKERSRPGTTHDRKEVREPLEAYTVEQVAKMLHISRDKVYYLLRTGQLRSIKIGKLRRITDQQLAEFIASLDDAA